MVMRFVVTENQGEFEPLPKGTYEFDIDEAEERVSSNNNPQIMMKMTVTGGPYGGKRATCFITMSEKSGWRAKELFEALGMPLVNEGKDATGADIYSAPDAAELIGRRVVWDVTVREYEGRPQNDFKKPRAPGAMAAGPTRNPQQPMQPAAPPQGYQPPPQQQGYTQGGYAPPQQYQQPPQQNYGPPPQGFQPPPQQQQQQQYHQPPQQPPQGGPPGPQGGPVDRRPRPGQG